MAKNTNNSQGIVALITSIVVALLLIVITSSAISLMSTELRNASDFDNSIKAYFAAEAGVEDALAKIRRDLVAGRKLETNEICDPLTAPENNLSGDNVIAYTCQIVSTKVNSITGSLSPEESVQLDLGGISGFNEIVVSWNQRGSTDPQGWNTANIPSLFPPGSGWAGTYPAVLETSIIRYPRQAEFESNQIETKSFVLKPHPFGTDNPNVGLGFYFGSGRIPDTPISTRCVPAAQNGEYDCKARFTSFPDSHEYFLRLSSRFGSTNYRVEAFQGNTRVEIPDVQLSIDVTGKAGDIFRRVLVKFPLSDQPSVRFVILANETICKVLEVDRNTNIANTETACDI